MVLFWADIGRLWLCFGLIFNLNLSSLASCLDLWFHSSHYQHLVVLYLYYILRFLCLSLGIGPNDRTSPFNVDIRATLYLRVTRNKSNSSVVLSECVIH